MLTKMAPVKKMKVGCAGLGRMGQRHANNFLNHTPRAELVAAFSPDSREIAWAKENLEPYGVTLYMDYDEMLKHEGLEAVVLATVTAVHAEQAIKAIMADKHVLSEKPLSTSDEISQQVVDAATKKPHLKVMCGFSRRFDASYRDVKAKIDAGLIGKPIVFHGQTGDKRDPSGFFVQYAQFSGGIFVDCTIHDIDLALWFFGEENVVKSIYAAGVTAIEPGLRQYNDCDNAVGIVEFHSDQIAYFYVTRMMAAGQEDQTFIVGTEGKLTVNQNPAINLVHIHDKLGVRRQIPQNYFERFSEGFTREANQFTAAVLDDLPTPLDPQGAVHAVKIARALQESMNTGQKIMYDENEQRIN
ncbi:hypothetical protein V1508DRAFT_377188 [Lipomyces doorenjongii]|uniref:uncharacterized protein n=1 Tax=Lipomyces doorenjongii TaxID=383834 RepID=UPI0034CE94DD